MEEWYESVSEQSSWSTLRSQIAIRGGHVQRFEDKSAEGVPDSNVCIDGIEWWLEGKFLEVYPVRDKTLIRVKLKPPQALWLHMRARAGGRCAVWVRVPNGWFLSQSFFELRDGFLRGDMERVGTLYRTAKDMLEALFPLGR